MELIGAVEAVVTGGSFFFGEAFDAGVGFELSASPDGLATATVTSLDLVAVPTRRLGTKIDGDALMDVRLHPQVGKA